MLLNVAESENKEIVGSLQKLAKIRLQRQKDYRFLWDVSYWSRIETILRPAEATLKNTLMSVENWKKTQ